MQFFEWRHPEIRMRLELLVQPGGAGFLRSHAQEIRACLTGEAVKPLAVTVDRITMIAVARFECPSPRHGALFSIRRLKCNPEPRDLSYVHTRRSCARPTAGPPANCRRSASMP